jgi:SAM-dependent methyltransferase
MLRDWHRGPITAIDDLSGFGPGHRLQCDTFVPGDVQSLPFTDGQFDVAVLAEVLEHVGDPVTAIREAARVATVVLITTPFEQAWQVPIQYHVSGHMRYAFPQMFAAQLLRAVVCGEHGILRCGLRACSSVPSWTQRTPA